MSFQGQDTSQVRMFYAEETGDWASVPTGSYTEVRVTGEGLSENKESVQSEEIRADRQVTDVQETQIDADGNIDFELTYSTFDDFFEGVLLERWDSPLDISPTSVDVVDTDTFVGATDDFTDMEEGQWFQTSGFADAANNGIFRASSFANSDAEVTVQYATLTNTSDESGTSFDGERIVNGTKDIHFTIEKEYSDVTEYLRYPGTYFSTMDLSVEAGSVITGSFDVMSQQEEINSSQTPSSITSANTNPMINATSHVSDIRIQGTSGFTISSLSFSYDNAVRERPAVGQATTQQFGTGTIVAEGSIEAYFENSDLYDQYIGFVDSDVSFRVEDDDGNIYYFTFAQLKWTDGEAVTPGIDEDVFASLDFQAFRPRTATVGTKTFQIDKFSA